MVNFIKKHISCLTACLLLLVFSAIQLVEVLHSHAEEQYAMTTIVHKKGGSQPDIIKNIPECKFCKDLAHHQQHYFFTEIPANPLKAIASPIVQYPGFVSRLFEVAVNSWTNKGPPAYPLS